MSFGRTIVKGVKIPGLQGGRLLLTDEHSRLTELDSGSLSVLGSVSSGKVLGRSAPGEGEIEVLSQIPLSTLPSATARLDQAGAFAGLVTLLQGGRFAPLGSDPTDAMEGQVWWRDGSLWMKDASGVVPFIQAGTWTPSLRPETVGNFAATYTLQAGTWVRVGRTVTVGFSIQTSSMTFSTAAGQMRVIGLPFAALNEVETLGTSVLRNVQGLNLPSSVCVMATPSPGSSMLMLQRHFTGSNSSVLALQVGATSGFASGQNVTLSAWGLSMRIA